MAQGRIDAVDRYIAAAQGAVKRAAALTHRLLAFSRRQTLDPKPTNVNRLIAGMEELIRRTVGPSIQMEVVGAGGLWPTLVDPNQLENALLNLCINARDAMPDGGRLTIETANKWLDERAAKERELAAGTICFALRHRHRHGHDAGGHRARFRAVFHDQAVWTGHRPRLVDDLWLCPAVRRTNPHLLGGGQRARPCASICPGTIAMPRRRTASRTLRTGAAGGRWRSRDGHR